VSSSGRNIPIMRKEELRQNISKHLNSTRSSLETHIPKAQVCCSVLQCVAVCCSVLQCVAVCCSVLQCHHRRSLSVLALPCVLQCVAVCCCVLQCVADDCSVLQLQRLECTRSNIETHTPKAQVCCSALQCVAVSYSVLLRVADCCSALKSVSVCCIVLQRHHLDYVRISRHTTQKLMCVAACCSVL